MRPRDDTPRDERVSVLVGSPGPAATPALAATTGPMPTRRRLLHAFAGGVVGVGLITGLAACGGEEDEGEDEDD